jgi:type II secretory pathway pseudopilin PulG
MLCNSYHEHAAMVLSSGTNRRAFTRVELLVLVALSAVLAGVLLPAILRADADADRLRCQNNLKDLGIAVHNCNDTYAKLPPAVGSFPAANSDGTVQFYLLPFVEQEELFKDGADGAGGFSVWSKGVYNKPVTNFLCPADASGGDAHLFMDWLATSSYASNYLVFAQGGARIPASFPDGTSNTILFAERFQICNQSPCAWAYSGETEWAPTFAYSSVAKFQTQPAQAQCNPALAQGIHPGGIEVGIADGSARTVANSITPQTWYYACCPNDGMVLGPDW